MLSFSEKILSLTIMQILAEPELLRVKLSSICVGK